MRDGLKVLVFEQTSQALEKRLGFRVQEYGLRRVFPRVPDHPALAGLEAEHLRDWRGAATIVPPRREYESRPGHGPTVLRCGLPVTRLLANLGAGGATPLLPRFSRPPGGGAAPEKRWLTGFYLEEPVEWDDPYRFFRW